MSYTQASSTPRARAAAAPMSSAWASSPGWMPALMCDTGVTVTSA